MRSTNLDPDTAADRLLMLALGQVRAQTSGTARPAGDGVEPLARAPSTRRSPSRPPAASRPRRRRQGAARADRRAAARAEAGGRQRRVDPRLLGLGRRGRRVPLGQRLLARRPARPALGARPLAAGRGGWQWVPGFWADEDEDELEYLPPPPPSLDAGPSTPAPGRDSVYVPGCWVYSERQLLLAAGLLDRPPARLGLGAGPLLWTPGGCLFVDGYWDYPLHERGLLFAPVLHRRRRSWPPGFVYSPTYVVQTGLPARRAVRAAATRNYYFGDYFEDRYADAASCLDRLPLRPAGLRPELRLLPAAYRDRAGWEDAAQAVRGRRPATSPRPPRTLVQQTQVINNITVNKTENKVVNKNVNITNVQNVTVSNSIKQVNNTQVTALGSSARASAEGGRRRKVRQDSGGHEGTARRQKERADSCARRRCSGRRSSSSCTATAPCRSVRRSPSRDRSPSLSQPSRRSCRCPSRSSPSRRRCSPRRSRRPAEAAAPAADAQAGGEAAAQGRSAEAGQPANHGLARSRNPNRRQHPCSRSRGPSRCRSRNPRTIRRSRSSRRWIPSRPPAGPEAGHKPPADPHPEPKPPVDPEPPEAVPSPPVGPPDPRPQPQPPPLPPQPKPRPRPRSTRRRSPIRRRGRNPSPTAAEAAQVLRRAGTSSLW